MEITGKVEFCRQVFLFIYFYFSLHGVFIAVCGLSLVVASGGYSFVVVRSLLTAVASLVVENRL